MATTEVDTAETVPLTPLQKIEIDDKELLTPEYNESTNQLSKDELKNIETEITKALETAEQLGGDGDTETTPVHNDAEVRSHDSGAQENVGASESRVLENVISYPEVAEESNSTKSHVHTVTDEKDELSVNEKLEEPEESGSLVKEVDKLHEKENHVPCVDIVDKGEAEEPAESQSGAAKDLQLSDHILDLETHKEGETQPGADASSYNVKEVSSVTVEQTEENAVVNDAKEEHENPLDSEAREKVIPENQPEVSKKPESIPNALYEEHLEVAERSEELQEKEEKSISDYPSTSQKDNDDSEREKTVEVIVDDSENKELTRATDTLQPHEEVVKKEAPDTLTQPEESLHVQDEVLKTEEKEIDSTQVEEHVVKNTTKVEEDQEQQAISIKDNPLAEKLESSSNIIPEKKEDEEQSESAVKTIPDVEEENRINEQHSEEAHTEFKEHVTTKETDTTQLALEETENEDVEISTQEGSSSHIEETQSAESKNIDDDQTSEPKIEDERDGVSQTEITEEKILGSRDVEVETGNLQPVVLEKPQETDTEDLVKHAAMEKADTVQVTEEPLKGVYSIVESNEADISPVSSFSREFNEQEYEEKIKEESSPTSHVEFLLQEEENKSEKKEEIIEVNDGHISTSIDDSRTEQTNIVGHDKNILTESHEEDVTGVSLDDENQDSNKNKISEQLITEIEEEPEKNASHNDKPDFEIPESLSNTSTEKPEEVDTESAREMNFPLPEPNENTEGAETEILDHNADVKEILSTDQIPAETNDVVSDDAGTSILPEEKKDDISATSKTVDSTSAENIEEKDDISATSKTVDSTPAENIEEKDDISATSKIVDSTPAENIDEKDETSEMGSEKIVEPEKLHDIDSLQISNDENAETKQGENSEKIEIPENEVADIISLTITEDDSSPELSLHENSKQKETLKDEEDDEKHVQIDETPETNEIVPAATSVEIKEDAPEKDGDTATSLNVQEPVEKVEHVAETNIENPTSDIQDISEGLPVESRSTVDVSNGVEEVVTNNVEGKNSGKIVEETHVTEEVSTQAEQIDVTPSLENIESKVETPQEVVSEPDPDDSENLEKETEPGLDDSEKLKQVSEPDPDDSEHPEKVSPGDLFDKESLKQISVSEDLEQLKQVSEPDPVDKENLEQVSIPEVLENLTQVSEHDLDDTDNLKQLSEQDPDDTDNLKQVSEPDPDDSENLKKISEPDHANFEFGVQASEPDPDDSEKVKKDPELDSNDNEILELSQLDQNLKNTSEPESNDSENQETVDKEDTPDNRNKVTINEHPTDTTVEVLDKTYEQQEEDTVSDNVSSVNVVEETVIPRSIDVLNTTDTAPDVSVENSVHENSSNYQIPELKAEEKSESSQTTREPAIESSTEHVEEPSSEEIVGAIQHNEPKIENKTSEVSDEHTTIKEVEGAEGLLAPGGIFVDDSKPNEAEEEIKNDEGFTNVAADAIADESEIPVTEVEVDQTHVHKVKDHHGEDEILEDEADKEVILQEDEPGNMPKEAEEPEPSASSFTDDGTADIGGKEAPEETLQEDKDGQEEDGNITEKIAVSKVFVQPHDNAVEEPEHFPRDTELSTSIVNDEKIISLTIQKEKEEQQDNIEPEVVIKDGEENIQSKIDDNVEEKGTAPEGVVLKEAQVQPDELLNEPEGYEKLPSTSNSEDAKIPEGQKDPEEVEEKISVKNQPEEGDTVTDIKTAEDAVLQQEEKEGKKEIIQLPNESEETVEDEHISYQIPELRNEEKSKPSETTQEPVAETETEHPEEKVSVTQHKDANEDNQTNDASDIIKEESDEGQSSSADTLVDDRKPDEEDSDIQKEDLIEKVADEAEPETPVSLVQGNQNLVEDIKEEHLEGEILKDEEVKEAIVQEIEPEHLPEPSVSSSNDDGITHLVSRNVPEEVLQEENDKDGLGRVESVTEKISLSEELDQPHNNSGDETEHMPSKTEETEQATPTIKDENTTSLKSQEIKEETQEEVEPEIVTEDIKEKEQETDDIVDENRTTEEVIVPVVEKVQLPESNESSATGLNAEDAIEREKGPEEVQEVPSVERPEEDDNVSKIADTILKEVEKEEEILHLTNEAEDTEIPSYNFTALKDDKENENKREEENEQYQAKETDTIHEKGSASEVLIHEDKQSEQPKHLESEDEEAKPSTTHEEVVQENKAVKIEYLPSESVEAGPIGEDETATILKTEEAERILQDEKKSDQVIFETEEKENAEEELKLKPEDDQGQLVLVSDGTENLEPPVSYTSEGEKTNLESDEVLEDLEEKIKSDHFEGDDQEKETVNRELVLQEPPASHGNDDDITTLKSEENPENLQEQKETKLAEDDGDTQLSQNVSEAAIHGVTLDKDNDLANTAVEADSSVENALAGEIVTRGVEDPELVEEKDQVIDEKVSGTELSVEEDRKGDELEHSPILIKDTEAYASSVINHGEQTDAEETKKGGQETEDDIRQQDPSNEDLKSSLEELNAGSIETKNNLESKEPESVEDNAKEDSIIENNSSLGELENKEETSYLETQNIKSVDEIVANVEETKIINELHESIVEKEVDEVVTVSVALPTADDKFDDASESLQSVDISDSEVQRDIVETAKETKEEKLESITPFACKEDEKNVIHKETHQENLKGSEGNEVPILGDENQYADEFVTTITDEKNLQTLETSEVPTPAVEDDQVNAPENAGKHEAKALGDDDQRKLFSSETSSYETTEKITQNKTYVEADTSAGSNTEEPQEISSLVLSKVDEIQKENKGDETSPTIKEKSDLALEDVTPETIEDLVTEKVPDESAIVFKGTTEQIAKDDIITKEISVNEGQNHEPLSSGSPKPEELGAREVAELKEVLQMQEASLVTTQLEDKLNKQHGEAKYIEVTQKAEPEDENNAGRHDSSSEIMTELVKLQEPEAIIAPLEDERTGEVASTELVEEETKGETDLVKEEDNIVQFQEKITGTPADDKSESSHKISEEKKVSADSPEVVTRGLSAVEGKQINEAREGELLENKVEPIKESETVTAVREVQNEVIQELNTNETKGYKLDVALDESSTNDAAIKVNHADRDPTQLTITPSEQVELFGIPLKTPITNIVERQEGGNAAEVSKPPEPQSTEDVTEGTASEDLIGTLEKKDDIKHSCDSAVSTTRELELVAPQSRISTVLTEGSDTTLAMQQFMKTNSEVPSIENTCADKNPKDGDGPTPVSTESEDVPTEIQQNTARSQNFEEVVQPEISKKTESQIHLNIHEENSFSELLQISPKDTIQMTQQPNQETNPAPKKEDLQTEDPKTDEDKDDEEEEEGEDHKKTDSSSDGVIVEASRDMDVKSPQKKHHGILSGVGTKVKNSISKVKKAITGKSSHHKPPSPK